MTSEHITDENGFGFKLFSHKERKPADLLYRALAHINHNRFKLRCLDVNEGPTETTALLHLSPKRDSVFAVFSIGKRPKSKASKTNKTDATLSIKVTASDTSQHRFDVEYFIAYGSHIDLYDFETVASLSETVVLNLFLEIPGIVIERQSIVVGVKSVSYH